MTLGVCALVTILRKDYKTSLRLRTASGGLGNQSKMFGLGLKISRARCVVEFVVQLLCWDILYLQFRLGSHLKVADGANGFQKGNLNFAVFTKQGEEEVLAGAAGFYNWSQQKGEAGLGMFSLPPFQASRLVTSVATICFVILGVLSTRILSGSRTRKMVYSLFPQIPVTSTHSHTVHT
jgi:hypothetical protein